MLSSTEKVNLTQLRKITLDLPLPVKERISTAFFESVEDGSRRFYRISVARVDEEYLVFEVSGEDGIPSRRQAWFKASLDEASRLYARLVRERAFKSLVTIRVSEPV